MHCSILIPYSFAVFIECESDSAWNRVVNSTLLKCCQKHRCYAVGTLLGDPVMSRGSLLLNEEALLTIGNTLWCMTDFGRDPHIGERRSTCRFFLSCKQGGISPTSGRPNFTKFAHNTCFCVHINPFATKFSKSFHKGSFFPKNPLSIQTTSDFIRQ